jgi:hypothetical protein
VFDADLFAGMVGPTGEITGRENTRDADLDILVDRDATIDREARSGLSERPTWGLGRIPPQSGTGDLVLGASHCMTGTSTS